MIKIMHGSRKCIIGHYRYFFGINLRFQPRSCNSYHDMEQNCIFSVFIIRRDDYRIEFWRMTKNEAQIK